MTTYTIYSHPELGHKAVKNGFSWPAFLFGIIWAMVKGLWWLVLVWLGVIFAVMALQSLLLEAAGHGAALQISLLFNLVTLGAMVWVGSVANLWVSNSLLSRGYTQVGEINARAPDQAVERYLAQQGEGAPKADSSASTFQA